MGAKHILRPCNTSLQFSTPGDTISSKYCRSWVKDLLGSPWDESSVWMNQLWREMSNRNTHTNCLWLYAAKQIINNHTVWRLLLCLLSVPSCSCSYCWHLEHGRPTAWAHPLQEIDICRDRHCCRCWDTNAAAASAQKERNDAYLFLSLTPCEG